MSDDNERIRELTERVALLVEQVDWLESRLRLLEQLAYLPGPLVADAIPVGHEAGTRI